MALNRGKLAFGCHLDDLPIINSFRNILVVSVEEEELLGRIGLNILNDYIDYSPPFGRCFIL